MKRINSKAGVTLVESMIAFAVLLMVSMGVYGGLMQTRRLAEVTIYQNTALTVAQGYLEQIKNMEFSSLDLPTLPTLINEGGTDPLITSALVADPVIGAPGDIVNLKLIDINNTPETPEDDMNLSLVVYIQNITDRATGIGNARKIVIRYTFSYSDNKRNLEGTDVIYGVRSEVPTF